MYYNTRNYEYVLFCCIIFLPYIIIYIVYIWSLELEKQKNVWQKGNIFVIRLRDTIEKDILDATSQWKAQWKEDEE